MLTEREIRNKVIGIVNSTLSEGQKPLPTPTVLEDDNGTYFYGDLGFDSLKVTELFMECESEFDIQFTDEEIVKTDTVEKLINKIVEKLDL